MPPTPIALLGFCNYRSVFCFVLFSSPEDEGDLSEWKFGKLHTLVKLGRAAESLGVGLESHFHQTFSVNLIQTNIGASYNRDYRIRLRTKKRMAEPTTGTMISL